MARDGESDWHIVVCDVYERWVRPSETPTMRQRMVRVSPQRETVRVKEARARLSPASGRRAVELLAQLGQLTDLQDEVAVTVTECEMDPLPGL